MTIDSDKSCHVLTPLVSVGKCAGIYPDTSLLTVPIIRPANHIVSDRYRQIFVFNDIHECVDSGNHAVIGNGYASGDTFNNLVVVGNSRSPTHAADHFCASFTSNEELTFINEATLCQSGNRHFRDKRNLDTENTHQTIDEGNNIVDNTDNPIDKTLE